MQAYRLGKLLGGGTFGDVYLCQSPHGDSYAIKVLKDNSDARAIARFQREVQILLGLNHPNIVKVIEHQLNTPPYSFVMPLYDQSLQQLLPQIIGNVGVINRIFASILEAMEFAHKSGCVHRDLKPSNVLVANDGRVAITDFGLGRILSEHYRLTASGDWMGTPGYASPEQWTGQDAKHADGRSDIYTLGIILYELYVGFRGAVTAQNLLPPGIRLIVDRCVQQNPDDRFQTIEDLIRYWNLATDPNLEQKMQVLREAAGLLSTSQVLGPAELRHSCELLIPISKNPDQLTELLLIMGSAGVDKLRDVEPGFVSNLLDIFIRNAITKIWSSEEALKIGDFCESLSITNADLSIRVKMTLALAAMAKNQRLLGKIKKRLVQQSNALETAAIGAGLLTLNKNAARIIFDAVVLLQNVPPPIRIGLENNLLDEPSGVASNTDVDSDWQRFVQAMRVAKGTSFSGTFERMVGSYKRISRTLVLELRECLPDKYAHLLIELEDIWAKSTGYKVVLYLHS